MNFLAHFDLTKSDSGDFLIGSLLPDIAKRAGIQITPLKLKTVTGSEFNHIIHGIQFHWFADKAFHSSELFVKGMSLWKSQLESSLPGMERKFFLYHLLFEIWLDRLILSQDPLVGHQMYRSMEASDLNILQKMAEIGFEDGKNRIVHTLKGFVEKRFVLEYSKDESFTGISADVFSSVTNQTRKMEWEYSIQKGLMALQEFEPEILSEWGQFKKDLVSDWADLKPDSTF